MSVVANEVEAASICQVVEPGRIQAIEAICQGLDRARRQLAAPFLRRKE